MSYKNICLQCRKAFSVGTTDYTKMRENIPCPHCAEPTVFVSEKFKPPKQTDKKAWAVVKYLIDNGFRYSSQYDKNYQNIRYPSTMEEGIEFVKKYKR